ncbi:diacylglycerol/lipid kinase family protein [Ornithinimicrobium sediminis]|uniref:diacylglycerol/lipid kinase family protein n=1 Tax=Ornithinimicrobium sediminis TaxID=2904603 RepID=UPI001E2D35EF|nr:diacylglycerol kinase family protein [Ornithinimicrobium sediminis]MCE0487975.1 hypothetical protein [Ornithinimicrobium sediminis]
MSASSPVLVLANAAAGSADDEAVEAVLAALREEADVEVVVPDEGGLRLALAGARGRDLVVMGGDGSVHAVVAELDAMGDLAEVASLGIVPMGTGNDLARTLGLPTDPKDAARVAVRGHLRPMDLLRDDAGGIVVNVVHAGLGAEATRHADEVKGLLGATAYAAGAVRAGLTSDGWRLRVVVDDEVVVDGARRTLLVSTGIGSSVGGGTPVTPQASPTDGLADVMVATVTGAADRVSFARDLSRGEHTRRDDVTLVRGRVVTVEAVSQDEAFDVNADGEVSGPCLRRTWTVEPAAWHCRVPDRP